MPKRRGAALLQALGARGAGGGAVEAEAGGGELLPGEVGKLVEIELPRGGGLTRVARVSFAL